MDLRAQSMRSVDDEVLVWVTRGANYVVWPRGFFVHSGEPTRMQVGRDVEYIVAVRGSCDRPEDAKRAAWRALSEAGYLVPLPY